MVRLALLAVLLPGGGRAATLAGPVPCEVAAGKPGAAGRYDPYRYDDYAKFREMVARPNGWGVLYVGVPDESVGTYAPHLQVPSGFKGLADGVYDCRYDHATKRPVMERRRPQPAPMPRSAEGWYWHLLRPGSS